MRHKVLFIFLFCTLYSIKTLANNCEDVYKKRIKNFRQGAISPVTNVAFAATDGLVIAGSGAALILYAPFKDKSFIRSEIKGIAGLLGGSALAIALPILTAFAMPYEFVKQQQIRSGLKKTIKLMREVDSMQAGKKIKRLSEYSLIPEQDLLKKLSAFDFCPIQELDFLTTNYSRDAIRFVIKKNIKGTKTMRTVYTYHTIKDFITKGYFNNN